MLWLPWHKRRPRKHNPRSSFAHTRSGAEFSAFSLPKDTAVMPSVVTALQEREFDVGPLLAHAAAAESDDQSDCEQDDVDDLSPPDPSGDIDDIEPPPPPPPCPCSLGFELTMKPSSW
ncbi:hypothetical protein B0H13DRAFT_2300510 [Mycena leptocephala]|nr:hypothetical protein B0H13DRAFT_2300510 [Mycena leptocephala]